MPILVFRRQLPECDLLAALDKFKNASNITVRGTATEQVRASSVLQGFRGGLILIH